MPQTMVTASKSDKSLIFQVIAGLRRLRPISVLKIILKALLIVNSVPIVEWLIRGRKRKHLDAISALQVNLLDRPYVSGIMLFKVRTDCATIAREMERHFIGDAKGPQHKKLWREVPVTSSWFWPYWKVDEDFQTSRHIHRVTDRMDHPSLELWVGDHQVKDVDRAHPLWDVHVFENYTNDAGEEVSAAVFKMHHCYGDGFTLSRVLMQAADPKRPPELQQNATNSDTKVSVKSSQPRKREPKQTPMQLFGKGLGATGKLLAMTNDPVSPLKASRFIAPEGKRYLVWHVIDHTVEDVKAIGKPYGQTVNDILIAALSVTLEKLAARGRGKVPAQVNAAMWCSLNPFSTLYKDPSELPLVNSNSGLGAVYLMIPLGGSAAPKENCAEISSRIKKLTTSPEPLLANRIMAFFGAWPQFVARPIWDALSNKVSISASNMPGPPFPMTWCSVPIDTWLFFVPPNGTISTFVTIYTVNGRVNFGLGGDASIMELESLRQAVQVDFDEALRDLKQAQA